MAYTWSTRNGNYWQAGVEIAKTGETDTSITLRVRHAFRSNYRINLYDGISWQCWADHGTSERYYNSSHGYGTSTSWTESQNDSVVVLETHTVTVQKTTGFTFYADTKISINTVSSGSKTVTASYWVPPKPTYVPNPPVNVSAKRNSDTSIDIAWENSIADMRPYTGVYVYRSVDGEPYTLIRTAGSTDTSYADNTVTANHAYIYKVISYNSAGNSTDVFTNVIYTTPAAPVSISVQRDSETTVALTINNTLQNTSEQLEIERRPENGAWSNIGQIDAEKASQVFSDDPGGGRYQYRARNKRGTLLSAYTESAVIATITAPAAPTITAPANGSTVAYEDEYAVVTWRHNTIDGSDQSQAEVKYTIDGQSNTLSIQGATNQLRIPLAQSNKTITVQARTKGVSPDWSPWSAVTSFSVKNKPKVTLDSPEQKIVTYPVEVDFTYTDQSGTLYSALFELLKGNTVVYSSTISNGHNITADMLLLDNNSTYTARLTVTSTSTLKAIVTKTLTTAFELPSKPVISARIVDGSVELIVTQGKGSATATDDLYLYRIEPDGQRVYLGTDGARLEVVDRLCPLDTFFNYEAVATSRISGSNSSIKRQKVNSCGMAYFNWGDTWQNIARINKQGEFGLTSTLEKNIFDVGGRELPLLFYGEHKNIEDTITGRAPITYLADDKLTSIEAFTKLQNYAGIVCIRLPYYDGYKVFAAVDVAIRVLNAQYKYADVTISYRAVDHGLA